MITSAVVLRLYAAGGVTGSSSVAGSNFTNFTVNGTFSYSHPLKAMEVLNFTTFLQGRPIGDPSSVPVNVTAVLPAAVNVSKSLAAATVQRDGEANRTPWNTTSPLALTAHAWHLLHVPVYVIGRAASTYRDPGLGVRVIIDMPVVVEVNTSSLSPSPSPGVSPSSPPTSPSSPSPSLASPSPSPSPSTSPAVRRALLQGPSPSPSISPSPSSPSPSPAPTSRATSPSLTSPLPSSPPQSPSLSSPPSSPTSSPPFTLPSPSPSLAPVITVIQQAVYDGYWSSSNGSYVVPVKLTGLGTITGMVQLMADVSANVTMVSTPSGCDVDRP